MLMNQVAVEPILRVEDLLVRFQGFTAINHLNFSVKPGELRVVIGPNGAGKTTLLDCITGKTRPLSGRITFKGHNLLGRAEQEIACLGVGRKFQTPNVFRSLNVRENLQLALKGRRNVLVAVTGGLSRNREQIEEILETVGLKAKANWPAGLLAHGEKQWLELGMLMAQDPELLLIDEPVAGMTPRESVRTGELLMKLARKHTLIVIEHDMEFVKQIAHTVTVLDEGKLLCEGTVQEVQSNPKVIEVYLGQDKLDHASHTELVGQVR